MSKSESNLDQAPFDQHSDGNAGRAQGVVKWFSEERGYGFVQVEGEDIFIHRNTLLSFGIQKIQHEDILTISLADSERGKVVDKVYGLERPPIPDELLADTPEEGELKAVVKFFSNHKGYGFVIAEGEPRDIFIHFRALERCGLSTLESGQRLLVRLEDDEKGKRVTTIRIYIGDDFPEALDAETL